MINFTTETENTKVLHSTELSADYTDYADFWARMQGLHLVRFPYFVSSVSLW
jgi:hypothetical protein